MESIEPAFLNPWDPGRLSHLPIDEIMRLQQEGTPSSVARLKQIYLGLFPAMDDYFKKQVESATTADELRRVFDSVTAQGRQARILVRMVFRHRSDDDDDAGAVKAASAKKDDDDGKAGAAGKSGPAKKDDDDDDDDLVGKVVTVWTDAGDCGFAFQPGETYLIYADDDEETGQLATSSCSRTARVSDAGDDLAYLYYYKNGGDASTRLEGFIASDLSSKFQADSEQAVTSIDSAVPGAIVRLQSDKGPRYASADSGGRFVFDGLAEGDYELTVFDSGYPRAVRQLGFPQQFHVRPKSCVRQILSAPPH